MLRPGETQTSEHGLTNPRSIFWHDYETWGAEPRRDRPCQFAGIRTDEDLNIIDDPVVIFCKPTPDYLPHPEACLVTGISPAVAQDKGLDEAEFCYRIAEQFIQPNTCVAGYNSIRFDDEVTRHMLYRCFYDPYEREWKNGNSRWDIIDLVRMTHALRPSGIEWPQKEDGTASFRLENLTAANAIEHVGAHDALSDVRATIDMAKLVKTAQPKLYDWLYQLRSKNRVKPLLDLKKKDMVLHVSGMFPASRGCLGVVMPLMLHPTNQNGIIVFDLNQDPETWLDLEPDAIRHLLFTRNDDLTEGEERVALKTVHINKCPALAPLTTLDEQAARQWRVDLAACERHRDKILADATLPDKLRRVFAEPDHPESTDPDHMLYSGGFFSDQDKGLMDDIRHSPPDALHALSPPFQDPRLPEMLFRYRARNYPDTLDADEQARWQAWCTEQLTANPNGVGLDAKTFFSRLDELIQEKPEAAAFLAELRAYGQGVCTRMGIAP